MSDVSYLSLAIYATQLDLLRHLKKLKLKSVEEGERGGRFYWIHSTKALISSAEMEGHFRFYQDSLSGDYEVLRSAVDSGCEVRFWVYFGLSSINRSFVISEDFVALASRLRADICIDGWLSKNNSFQMK